MEKTLDIEIHWLPQPKQLQLLEAAGLGACVLGTGGPVPPVATIIGYGGAAYGGKTDADLGLAAAAAFAYPGCNIAFFRRTFPELNAIGGAIKRSQELFTGFATYNKSEHTWYFPSGSRLQFCFADGEQEVLKFKSAQFDILIIDEATTFTWYMVDFLMTRNRATVDNITPFTVMTTNPGDVGHAWYLQLFDTVKGQGEHNQVKLVENPNGKQVNTYFIPAFIDDNLIGLERDPLYAARLEASDPELARAYLKGDWTVFAGQAFTQWRYEKHTCEYMELPDDWPTWRSMDYGFDHPFYVHWWKKDPGNGRHYIIREITGRQMTDPMIIDAIKTATLPRERIPFTYASPDMWAAQRQAQDVTTAAQNFIAKGIVVVKADDERVNGKRKFNNLLADLPDGRPGLQIFNTCAGIIKVMPSLVRDPKNPEDVKKVDGDDPYDSARYGLTNTEIQQQRQHKPQPAPIRNLFNGR